MRTGAYRQPGFTLIELMISVVIGMTLILVAGNMYVGSVRSSASIAGETDLRETSYYLLLTLQQHLNQAGFRAIKPFNVLQAGSFPVPAKDSFFVSVEGEWAQGQYVKADGQTLAIRFGGATTDSAKPDSSMVDCSGTTVAYDDVETLEFSVANNQLTCTTASSSEVLAGDSGGTIVEGSAVRLGIDDNEDRSADRFVGGDAASEQDFLSTVSIEMRLLLASEDRVTTTRQDYVFNGENFTATDRRSRAEIIIYVALKN